MRLAVFIFKGINVGCASLNKVVPNASLPTTHKSLLREVGDIVDDLEFCTREIWHLAKSR